MQREFRYSTTIDVGCADGTFFLLHQYFGIFAGATPVNIEANPIYEESLRAIKDCAGGHYVIGAASDADGEAEMTLGVHPYWSSLRDKDDRYWKQIHNLSEGSSKVRTFTIDGLAEQLSLKPPYLLKLDVQGAEAQVLRGARRVLEQTDVVICEADMHDFQSLNGLMVEAGFDLFDITNLQRIEGFTLEWFYPVYLSRRLDSIKASTLWNSSQLGSSHPNTGPAKSVVAADQRTNPCRDASPREPASTGPMTGTAAATSLMERRAFGPILS